MGIDQFMVGDERLILGILCLEAGENEGSPCLVSMHLTLKYYIFKIST